MKKILGNPTKKELKTIEELVSQGVTQESIARSFGISPRTFILRKKDIPAIDDAIHRGKASGEQIAVGFLWKIVTNEEHKQHFQSLCFYLKTQCGWKETQVIEDKPKAGNGKVTKVPSKPIPKEKV